MKLTELVLICALALTGCNSQYKQPAPEKDLVLKCFNRASQITYKGEEGGKDYWQSPIETERLGTGDCEDLAFYLQDELRKEGIMSRAVAGELDITFNLMEIILKIEKIDGKKEKKEKKKINGHMWVEYQLGNDIYILDPTNGIILERRKTSPAKYVERYFKNIAERWETYNARLAEEREKNNKKDD